MLDRKTIQKLHLQTLANLSWTEINRDILLPPKAPCFYSLSLLYLFRSLSLSLTLSLSLSSKHFLQLALSTKEAENRTKHMLPMFCLITVRENYRSLNVSSSLSLKVIVIKRLKTKITNPTPKRWATKNRNPGALSLSVFSLSSHQSMSFL